LEELFEEWLQRVERNIVALVQKEGPRSASEIAAALNLSEKAVLSVIHRMARQGTIKITGVQSAM